MKRPSKRLSTKCSDSRIPHPVHHFHGSTASLSSAWLSFALCAITDASVRAQIAHDYENRV